MKEETKSKLKKYGKRAGIGLAFVSLFLLGVGVGACSARKAVGSSAEDLSQTIALPDLPEEDNLLNYALTPNSVISFGTNSIWVSPSGGNQTSYMLRSDYLPVGRYVVVTESESDFELLMGYISWEVYDYMRAGSSVELPIDNNLKGVSWPTSSPYFFDVTSSTFDNRFTALYLRVPSSVTGIYAVTEENYYRFVPSIAEITLPTDFNPIWLFGDAYKGAVYGMLSVNAEGASYTASLDVKFLSGGNLYDGVYFLFDHLANTWYQEPTSGEIVLADRYANDYHYPVGMYYRRFGETAIYPALNPEAFDCVWSPQWALTNDSEGNTHKYLTPMGAFASDVYRVLDVKAYGDSTPVSARWPNLDALALLRLKSSGFIITGETNLYDAFELLGGAFRSVADILNIQILPFMTLGMLMFIPLIVLVLFAIIRILNK